MSNTYWKVRCITSVLSPPSHWMIQNAQKEKPDVILPMVSCLYIPRTHHLETSSHSTLRASQCLQHSVLLFFLLNTIEHSFHLARTRQYPSIPFVKLFWNQISFSFSRLRIRDWWSSAARWKASLVSRSSHWWHWQNAVSARYVKNDSSFYSLCFA